MYRVEVRNDRIGSHNDVFADEFHITSFPFTQLKTSVAPTISIWLVDLKQLPPRQTFQEGGVEPERPCLPDYQAEQYVSRTRESEAGQADAPLSPPQASVDNQIILVGVWVLG